MARWERRERIGEIVSLVGQFVAMGQLAGTVHDGQNVCIDWDKFNGVSFALIRHLEPDQQFEDVWLYNRYRLLLKVERHLQRGTTAVHVCRQCNGQCPHRDDQETVTRLLHPCSSLRRAIAAILAHRLLLDDQPRQGLGAQLPCKKRRSLRTWRK
jgi:hypothetical protein